MARITFQGCVRAGQGKTIVVIFDLRQRNLPAFHAVALFATGAKLTFVDVGVAIGAFRSDIGEYRLGVALRASYTLMQSAQRILSLIVVEFRNRADRFPTFDGMAILTGNVQISVRAAGVDVAL